MAGRVLQVAQGARAFLSPISTPKGGGVKPSNTFSKDFFKNGVCAKREGGCAQSVQQIAQGGCTKTGASPKLHRGVPDGRLTLREGVCAILVHARRGVNSCVLHFLCSVFCSKTLCFDAAPNRIPPDALMDVVQKSYENTWCWNINYSTHAERPKNNENTRF